MVSDLIKWVKFTSGVWWLQRVCNQCWSD